MEGSYGRITEVSETTVIKTKKFYSSKMSLDINTQKHIHKLLLHILSDPYYILLKVPKLVPNDAYEMEKIDTRKPIFLGTMGTQVICTKTKDRLIEELMYMWGDVYLEGYAAWDFELYKQPDGRIMMIDFDKFKPRKSVTISEDFFRHPCFPSEFPRMFGCLNPAIKALSYL